MALSSWHHHHHDIIMASPSYHDSITITSSSCHHHNDIIIKVIWKSSSCKLWSNQLWMVWQFASWFWIHFKQLLPCFFLSSFLSFYHFFATKNSSVSIWLRKVATSSTKCFQLVKNKMHRHKKKNLKKNITPQKDWHTSHFWLLFFLGFWGAMRVNCVLFRDGSQLSQVLPWHANWNHQQVWSYTRLHVTVNPVTFPDTETMNCDYYCDLSTGLVCWSQLTWRMFNQVSNQVSVFLQPWLSLWHRWQKPQILHFCIILTLYGQILCLNSVTSWESRMYLLYDIRERPDVLALYDLRKEPDVLTLYDFREEPNVLTLYDLREEPDVLTLYDLREKPDVLPFYDLREKPDVLPLYDLREEPKCTYILWPQGRTKCTYTLWLQRKARCTYTLWPQGKARCTYTLWPQGRARRCWRQCPRWVEPPPWASDPGRCPAGTWTEPSHNLCHGASPRWSGTFHHGHPTEQ